MSERESSGPKLQRILSSPEVLLLTISALSPTVSVFVGGNAVLHLAGSGAAIAFLLGGIFSASFGLLYAEIGAAFPGAGGMYPSIVKLLGARWAFPYVVMTAPLVFPTLAFSALGFADYVRTLIPSLPILAITFTSLFAAATISVLNIKRSAHLTSVFLAIEIAGLAVVTVLAATHVRQSLFEVLTHPQMLVPAHVASKSGVQPSSVLAMALATVSGIWASAGANWALFFAEDMQDVQQRIGRVTAWAGAIAALTISVPMILIVMAIDDYPAMLSAEAPIAALVGHLGGPVVGTLISIGVATAIFNALIATFMGNSRFLYASGRDGIWPRPINRVLAFVHPRYHSTLGASGAMLVIGGLCALLSERSLLILISGNLIDYVLISAAVIVGRRRALTGHYFKAPLHPLVPLFGMFVMIASVIADWLDADAGRPSMILLGSVFVAALVYFEFRLRQTGQPIVMSGTGDN